MNRTYAPRDASHYSHRASRRTRPAGPPAPRTNRYGGKCSLCGQWVEPETGVALKPADRWIVQHNAGQCPEARKAEPQMLPDLGYFVRKDGKAVKVVESKTRLDDAGFPRRYGLVFTLHGPGRRPTWEYVKGAGLSVADLVPMTAGDAGRIGLAHGYCVNCCAELGGATLSAQVSALIGYGETCAKNNGWTYPKGVKAQRAFIASRR